MFKLIDSILSLYKKILYLLGLKKINVGFYVIYGSAFPGKSIVDKMLKGKKFNPIIIASPDVMRSNENMIRQINAILNYARLNGWQAVSGYNESDGEFIDHSDMLDFACIVNPYESMTHRFCQAEYLAEKNVKTFFIHYTYSVTCFDKKTYALPHFANFWKVFISNELTLSELKNDGIHVQNFKVIGYPKLDCVNQFTERENSRRKKIVLAPHHTFDYNELALSAWNTFADLYHLLPLRYQNVDFIFRPHPLWEINLKNFLGWSDVEFNQLLGKILNNTNVVYSCEDNYIDLFNSSDGLIHDCGSFLVECLYTLKPCCYMMKESKVSENFNVVGKLALGLHYHAYTIEQVYDFMDNVILNGNDSMLEMRSSKAREYLIVNHPYSSEVVLKYISDEGL